LAKDALRSLPVHPTQVYELLAALLVFGICMYLRRVRKFSGQVFVAWVVGYGILRPIIEAFRDDDQRGTVGPLSTSQFIGLVSAVLGIALLIHLMKRYRENPGSMRLWEMAFEPAGLSASGGARRVEGGGKRRKNG
jgi:prolipoprotein diacylglyceryltransferase